jgi:hypothetical protein
VLAAARTARRPEFDPARLALRFLGFSAATAALCATVMLVPASTAQDAETAGLDPVTEIVEAF